MFGGGFESTWQLTLKGLPSTMEYSRWTTLTVGTSVDCSRLLSWVRSRVVRLVGGLLVAARAIAQNGRRRRRRRPVGRELKGACGFISAPLRNLRPSLAPVGSCLKDLANTQQATLVANPIRRRALSGLFGGARKVKWIFWAHNY